MSETSQSKMPSVFDYDDYRKFIRDYYVGRKALDKRFSHRFFARLAGFKSSNFIKLIIDGKSNISPDSAERLAKAMKLSKEESHFFRHLALFNQSTSSEERYRHAQELVSSRTYRKIHPLNEALFRYTSKWYLSPLRGIVGLPGFREDVDWIAGHFLYQVESGDIRKGLDDLMALGLLKRDASGKLVQSQSNVASADEVTTGSVAMFHREMMNRAYESIDLVARDKRDISAMTLGLSPETAKLIKERIQKFRKEIVEIASHDEGAASAVFQLNFQLFPLFEIEEKDQELL